MGKRAYWPIYAAAERLGLTIGVHAGSAYHNPPTSVGWGSYHIEDYVAQATAFQTQLTSLIVEGVFARHPNLKMVMLETGFTWLPAYLWRLHKFWRGIRMETPWVDRAPLEIVRSNIRFSLQPVDAPPDPATLNRLFDHMQSDELLLFSTDYPHWQFDGDEVLPPGLSPELVRKIMIDNPLATYGRLSSRDQGDDAMNVQFRPEPSASVSVKTAIADCDIHPARATNDELYPFLAKRWHEHLEAYGKQAYHGMMEGPPYPKAQPNASRRDAWPPEGGPQGSSLSFMQKQLLDPYNVALGVLNPLEQRAGPAQPGSGWRDLLRDQRLADREMDSKDSRLKGSIVVANEDGVSAAAEIRKRAGDKNFVQVLLLSRNVEPLGQRRYWPVYEAAQEIGLPIGIHAFGFGGNPLTRRAGRASTSRRWSATRSASRPRWRAWCSKACSSAIRN